MFLFPVLFPFCLARRLSVLLQDTPSRTPPSTFLFLLHMLLWMDGNSACSITTGVLGFGLVLGAGLWDREDVGN